MLRREAGDLEGMQAFLVHPNPQILKPENPTIYLSIYLSVYLYLSIYLSIYLYIYITETPKVTYYLGMLRRETGDLEGMRAFLVHPTPEPPIPES